MITPQQILNPQVKPKWQLPVGVMESVVAYNCRKYGMPRPVLAMPLWEGAGNRAIDLSGKGNHGDFVGTTTWESNGILIDASGELVRTSSINHNIGTGDFTWCAWLDIPAILSGYSMAVANSTYHPGLYANLSTVNEFGFYWGSNKGSGSSLPVGKSFIVGLKRSGTLYYYLDGVQTANTPADTNSMVNAVFLVGNNNSGKNEPTYGTVKQAIFLDVALTAAQVKFLYENPYFMYEIPEELYGYVSAVAGVAPTSTLYGPLYGPMAGPIGIY